MKKIFLNKKRGACPANGGGFVILYTVLISSIVLAIVVGISTIAYQEVVLSSSAKEGNISFFAADTGADCALYWDINKQIFQSGSGTISCDSNTVLATVGTTPFELNLNIINGTPTNCARVTINKDTSTPAITTIVSKGYNVSCSQLSSNATPNPRTVERAIQVSY